MEAITFDPLVSRVATIPGNMRISSLSGLQLFPNWTLPDFPFSQAQEQDIMMKLEEWINKCMMHFQDKLHALCKPTGKCIMVSIH